MFFQVPRSRRDQASGLTPDGKPRHVLLQQAVKEYVGAKNRASLLHLLEPVSLAAEKSDWLSKQAAGKAAGKAAKS